MKMSLFQRMDQASSTGPEEDTPAPMRHRTALVAVGLVGCPRVIALVAALAPLLTGPAAVAQAPPVGLFRTLYTFTNGLDGATPYAGVVLSSNTLYGTATSGGANGSGTVFALGADGTGFQVLHSFSKLVPLPFPSTVVTNSDGATPWGGVVLSGDVLYGTARWGGTNATGTVFALNTDGTGFSALHSFTYGADGEEPGAGLTVFSNTLYGTTMFDGTNGGGTLFSVNTDGADFHVLQSFDGADGAVPLAALLASGNKLYGTTAFGGSSGNGTVFVANPDGTDLAVLHSFVGSEEGGDPEASLVLAGGMLFGLASGGGASNAGTVFAASTNGTAFTLLHTFTNGIDGENPAGGLVLSGVRLYGTAAYGGTSGDGTVFAVNSDGTAFTVIHAFSGSDGATPAAALLLSGNVLYGTTEAGGGASGSGTIFAITLAPAPAIDPNSLTVVGGQLQLMVTGVARGATVYLQTSSDPSGSANWVPVSTNVAAGTNLTITGITATNAPYGFFRILETFLP